MELSASIAKIQQRARESGHYSTLVRSYSRPHLLVIQDAPAPTLLTVSFPNGNQNHLVVPELTIEDCQAFLWKDCVVYVNIVDSQGREPLPTYTDLDDHREILNAIYQKRKAPSISQIKEFHQGLSEQVKNKVGKIPSHNPEGERSDSESEPQGPKVTASFSDVFVVIDHLNWEKNGVLLVEMNSSPVIETEGSKDLQREKVTPQSQEGLGIRRMNLHDAMIIVIRRSGHKDREIPRRDESEFYETRFGNRKPQADETASDQQWSQGEPVNRPTQ
ncbi:uncharacterized protein N7459_000570 [Penicillium hispanicum]|uniref:uncharacterized protein n=1 Tax=Penicillium hispanicum TaxID=1080232 RepID=UPI00253FD663|nr:uncharacterized protein N7459_000570 [Penicillium hispanicum]KAJ5594362.1 hypothetical protein N7459_000570 [Penicillium hispanicum]